jgi:YD repeat-containing protein
VTDSLGRITRYTYNAHNQPQTVTDPLGQTTRYTYDGMGNIATVEDPKGNITRYAYDGFGHLITLISPDTGTTTYSYDGQNRLSQFVRADGTRTSYQYDVLNRPTTITAGSLIETFSYDNCTNGRTRLCGFTDASGSTNYTYRLNGQIASQTSVIAGTGFTTNWTYDNRDRVSTLTYPGGNQVRYQYNGRSEPIAVTAVIGGVSYPVATNLNYLGYNLGPVTSLTMGDGSTVTPRYDTDLRLTALSTRTSAGTNLQALSYSYNASNNLAKLTNDLDSNQTQTYGYDALYRLSSVTAGIGNQRASPSMPTATAAATPAVAVLTHSRWTRITTALPTLAVAGPEPLPTMPLATPPAKPAMAATRPMATNRSIDWLALPQPAAPPAMALTP